MTEIASKIESIKNMKEDLHSIKMISQQNTEKMFQDLADFRCRLGHEMCKIESAYRSGRNVYQAPQLLPLNSDFEYAASQCDDSKQMSFILKEIENVQKQSKEILIELGNHSERITDTSTDRLNSLNNENCFSSTHNFDSPDDVNILFSKRLPCNTSGMQGTDKKVTSSSSTSSDREKWKVKIEKNLDIGNDALTKVKIDKLTKKLKEIQSQNDELRNVNENIQNLLMKLNDLQCVDAETVDKLETIKKESLLSNETYLTHFDSETVLNAENYKKFIQSITVTNKKPQGNMLTKIKVAKLIIKRIRSCSNITEQEHKYKVRVRQAEQNITFKAHHNKRQ